MYIFELHYIDFSFTTADFVSTAKSIALQKNPMHTFD